MLLNESPKSFISNLSMKPVLISFYKTSSSHEGVIANFKIIFLFVHLYIQ